MLSTTQWFIFSLVPRRMAKAMEKESRLWMTKCGKCGHETSIWDLGGIRYLAFGNPRRWRRCTKCLQGNWHQVYKKE